MTSGSCPNSWIETGRPARSSRVDPQQLVHRLLVAMVDREARHHLADRQPRAMAASLQAHEPVPDPRQRGEQDAVGDLDGPDLGTAYVLSRPIRVSYARATRRIVALAELRLPRLGFRGRWRWAGRGSGIEGQRGRAPRQAYESRRRGDFRAARSSAAGYSVSSVFESSTPAAQIGRRRLDPFPQCQQPEGFSPRY